MATKTKKLKPMKLFVYGTLKTGGRFWASALAPQVGVPDKVAGFELYDLGPFPAVVRGAQKAVVHGEVFLIDEPTLVNLDRIEGYPGLYDRAEVTTAGGHAAWVYFMRARPRSAQRLADGVWLPKRRY